MKLTAAVAIQLCGLALPFALAANRVPLEMSLGIGLPVGIILVLVGGGLYRAERKRRTAS